ncbi:DUF4177 domain-containing protein [Enterococcus faecalis]|uniref:DUF4177 domain-containing protein n=1 Tax=Enterococcus italicus TaxID=246144 RepID=UPI0020746FBF|nr:DUF4177 domain-containing protein [Enterococcus italicus]MCM6882113.1 DUF4177 domain-containing protein [Enterococcus italicus]
MYEYKFVNIKVGSLNGKPKDDYEQIIKSHAEDGWRLHTFAPLPFAAAGQAISMEIIFEREKQ